MSEVQEQPMNEQHPLWVIGGHAADHQAAKQEQERQEQHTAHLKAVANLTPEERNRLRQTPEGRKLLVEASREIIAKVLAQAESGRAGLSQLRQTPEGRKALLDASNELGVPLPMPI